MDLINDVKILNGLIFSDNRGSLKKTFYQTKEFIELNFPIKEIWFTKSKKNVIRGMHLQLGDNPSSKLISVIKGEIIDVLIDLRPSSSTYLTIFSLNISSRSNTMLFIPAGVAHGYRAIKNDTIVMYTSNVEHNSSDDVGILWDSIDFNWDISNPILSERDRNLTKLEDFLKENEL